MSNPISITKKQLCEKLGITSNTLRKWLNYRYWNELETLGYQKTQKILCGNVLNYICEKLVIIEN